MSKLSLFNSPLLLGFDQFERTLDRVSKSAADGYPPYNIEQLSEDKFRITLAVAGFSEADLAVRLENNQLIVEGQQAEDETRTYLHRGIAGRKFSRTFVLADGIEVLSAETDNGLLHITLARPIPETKVRKINVKASGTPSGTPKPKGQVRTS